METYAHHGRDFERRRDSLTGAASGAAFNQSIAEAIARSNRLGAAFTVVVAEVDDIAATEASLGPAAVDRILVRAAARLDATTRITDVVARLGDAKFGILLEGADSIEAAVVASEKLADAVSEPTVIDGQSTSSTLTMGAVLYPDDGDRPDRLVEKATAVMHGARACGRSEDRQLSARAPPQL